jgi:hypothetical protein
LGWILGANNNPWLKFRSNSKFQEEIISNSKPRGFSKFSFQILYESDEVSMEKVVHLLEKGIFGSDNV